MKNSVRFVLGGEIRELKEVDPTLTILEFLREKERKCGTKEGCAEGDCSACTVVIGELVDEEIHYQAVNACIQFVATLDGKQLITVEDLEGEDGSLHPAQQAMINCHGTQCGFCTPGFVMSLFAMYRSEPKPDRNRIDDALAGNLCRCTGYGTIINAAKGMYDLPGEDVVKLHEKETVELLKQIQHNETVEVGEDGRQFYSPKNIEELANILAKNPDACILAGSTDVGLWVTKLHRELETIVYIGDVVELKQLTVNQDYIEIGAGVTYTNALEIITEHYPDFGELIRRIGAQQVRNSGTIGGNIANGSPIGDTPPALIALDAKLILRKGKKQREIPLEDYFIEYGVQDLQKGEFVEKVKLPVANPEYLFSTYKISKRFDQDISASCGAFNLKLDKAGIVEDIRICYGGMASTPKRATQCEKYLIGKEWCANTVKSAMQEMTKDYSPMNDMRASKEYRMLVAQNLLFKFFIETTEPSEAYLDTRIINQRRVAHGY